MHELSICAAIAATAERHAGGRRVSAVSVRIGALRQVVPGSLRFYWDVVARETPCAGARLELEPVAALMRCAACANEWDPAPEPVADHDAAGPPPPSFRCPACGAAGAQALRGGELEVESIEVIEEEPCTAPG